MAFVPDRIGDSGDEVNEVDDVEGELQTGGKSALGKEMTSSQDEGSPIPNVVKRRIKALKKLQLETTKIEAKFYEEVHKLECKYSSLYSDYYEKRQTIVSGLHEPNDDECDFPSDEDEEEGLVKDLKTKVTISDPVEEFDVSGIPEFWLTIFKNVALLNDLIQPHDEPILKSLLDIKVIFQESNPMGFVLEFHFAPNDYFTNSVLTKEYEMTCFPEENDPFSFEGPEIVKCKGCLIEWKKGKNVTVKTLKRKCKNDPRAVYKVKTVPNESFFNFFSPPYVPDDQDADLDEDTRALLTGDFEIGHYIRERIVPRAVLYYTGEALEDEEDEFEDEEEEGEEDEDANK